MITFPDEAQTGCESSQSCPLIPHDEKMDLPLVNGLATYIEPDNLQYLADYLPEGTNLILNNRVKYPEIPQLMSDMDMIPQGGVGRVERLPNIEKVWERGFTGKGKKIEVSEEKLAEAKRKFLSEDDAADHDGNAKRAAKEPASGI